jgi:Fur family transcriptional regulator, zinc uptake regulator
MAQTPSLQNSLRNEGIPVPAPGDSGNTDWAIAKSEALCRSKGARLTPIRRRVLEALHASDKPLGAYDLVDLFGSQGRRMAPITVYRALDFLIEHGLAHRPASRNAYMASSNVSGARQTTAFLICEKCSEVNEVSSPDVADTVLKVLNEQGYQPRTRILEIMGHCAHCRDIH